MSSQRQKKRNAQFKKRRYDQKEISKSRQEYTKKTTEQEDQDQLEEPKPKDIEVTSTRHITEYAVSHRDQIRNEEVYEDHTVQDEEMLEQRMVQLLSTRLPPTRLPPPPTSLLMTTDERDTITNEDSLASLDLSLLSTSLLSLPLHERLHLDKELVDLCESQYKEQQSVLQQRREPSPATHLPSINLSFKQEPIDSKKTAVSSVHSFNTLTLITSLPTTGERNGSNEQLDKELDHLLKEDTTLNINPVIKETNEEVKGTNPSTNNIIISPANNDLDSLLDELLDI